jgi:hypothetical protein
MYNFMTIIREENFIYMLNFAIRTFQEKCGEYGIRLYTRVVQKVKTVCA